IYEFSFYIRAKRLSLELDIHLSRKRVCHDERRRCEIVCPHQGIDSTFEIAISTQNSGHNQPIVSYCGGNGIWKRTAVADAGRAPVADKVELQLLQIGHQSRLFQVIRHDSRT